MAGHRLGALDGGKGGGGLPTFQCIPEGACNAPKRSTVQGLVPHRRPKSCVPKGGGGRHCPTKHSNSGLFRGHEGVSGGWGAGLVGAHGHRMPRHETLAVGAVSCGPHPPSRMGRRAVPVRLPSAGPAAPGRCAGRGPPHATSGRGTSIEGGGGGGRGSHRGPWQASRDIVFTSRSRTSAGGTGLRGPGVCWPGRCLSTRGGGGGSDLADPPPKAKPPPPTQPLKTFL